MWPQLDSHGELWSMSCAWSYLEARGPASSSSVSVCYWLQDAGHGGHVAGTLPGEAPILPRAIL